MNRKVEIVTRSLTASRAGTLVALLERQVCLSDMTFDIRKGDSQSLDISSFDQTARLNDHLLIKIE